MPAPLLVLLTLFTLIVSPICTAAALAGSQSNPVASPVDVETNALSGEGYYDDEESQYIPDFELADAIEKKYRDPVFLAAEYKRGRMAFLFGQYEVAFKILEPLANYGHAKAQATLGWIYHTGKGKSKDLQQAFYWYQKAAKQNNPVAQNNMGVFYEQGLGVGKSEKNAAKWYREAAEWGYPYAQYNLGMLYQEGRGVKKDEKEAQFWLQIAALQGVSQAVDELEKVSGIAHGGKSVATTPRKGEQKAPQWVRHGEKSSSGKNSPHSNPHGSSGYKDLVNRIKSNMATKNESEFGDSLGAPPASDTKDKAGSATAEQKTQMTQVDTSDNKELVAETASKTPKPGSEIPRPAVTSDSDAVKSTEPKEANKNDKDWKEGPQFDKWLNDAQVAQQRLKTQKLEKKTNSHSLQIYNDDWVSEQNPEHYTVQLARSDELDWLLNMAKKQPMLKETAYYTTLIDGKKWYYLIYGNFKNRKDANTEMDNLPKTVKQWSPWIRRFSEVQSSMLTKTPDAPK